MKNIVIFGPPGAGKGTQATSIIEKFNLRHISTGDILRNEIKNNTELGEKVQRIYDEGGLVNDNLVISIMKNKLQNDMTPCH